MLDGCSITSIQLTNARLLRRGNKHKKEKYYFWISWIVKKPYLRIGMRNTTKRDEMVEWVWRTNKCVAMKIISVNHKEKYRA